LVALTSATLISGECDKLPVRFHESLYLSVMSFSPSSLVP